MVSRAFCMQAESYTATAQRMTAHKDRRGWPVFAGRVGEKRCEHMEGGTAARSQGGSLERYGEKDDRLQKKAHGNKEARLTPIYGQPGVLYAG